MQSGRVLRSIAEQGIWASRKARQARGRRCVTEDGQASRGDDQLGRACPIIDHGPLITDRIVFWARICCFVEFLFRKTFSAVVITWLKGVSVIESLFVSTSTFHRKVTSAGARADQPCRRGPLRTGGDPSPGTRGSRPPSRAPRSGRRRSGRGGRALVEVHRRAGPEEGPEALGELGAVERHDPPRRRGDQQGDRSQVGVDIGRSPDQIGEGQVRHSDGDRDGRTRIRVVGPAHGHHDVDIDVGADQRCRDARRPPIVRVHADTHPARSTLGSASVWSSVMSLRPSSVPTGTVTSSVGAAGVNTDATESYVSAGGSLAASVTETERSTCVTRAAALRPNRPSEMATATMTNVPAANVRGVTKPLRPHLWPLSPCVDREVEGRTLGLEVSLATRAGQRAGCYAAPTRRCIPQLN
jgi:hypothetical protein